MRIKREYLVCLGTTRRSEATLDGAVEELIASRSTLATATSKHCVEKRSISFDGVDVARGCCSRPGQVMT
jgi:hypothetical protein